MAQNFCGLTKCIFPTISPTFISYPVAWHCQGSRNEIKPRLPASAQTDLLPQDNPADQTASDLAVVLFETATLRSGFHLADTKAYGDRIERMLRLGLNVDPDEQARTASRSPAAQRAGPRNPTVGTPIPMWREPSSKALNPSLFGESVRLLKWDVWKKEMNLVALWIRVNNL